MNKNKLIGQITEKDFVKKYVKSIAESNNMSESELKRLYTQEFFSSISDEIDLEDLTNYLIEKIEKSLSNEKIGQFKFIKSDLIKILNKSLFVSLMNGFPVNINNLVSSGTMTANAGDSAEFIFVARAILAGFNCSSVDVRSSRYDAIIDYQNKLLRVQIKGISSGNSISFKDRDRGGQGIDHKHERNIGKRITSNDCDIYVAVDKQVGICYLIPMSWADALDDSDIVSVNLKKVEEFKENWSIVQTVSEEK